MTRANLLPFQKFRALPFGVAGTLCRVKESTKFIRSPVLPTQINPNAAIQNNSVAPTRAFSSIPQEQEPQVTLKSTLPIIVEAQGWVKNTDGDVELVATAPQTARLPRIVASTCPF